MSDATTVVPNQIYVRGISKRVSREDIVCHFSPCGEILKLDFCDKPRHGYCWLTFTTFESANIAVAKLHHSVLGGGILSVRHELGIDPINGNRINLQKSSLTIREPKIRNNGKRKKTHDQTTLIFSGKGVLLDGIEYPIPQGRYLIKLLRLCNRNNPLLSTQQSLIDLLTESRHNHNQAKELSESMAMVDATIKLFQLININMEEIQANIYVLADGKVPYTAAALALFLPAAWRLWSIDPILDFDVSLLGTYASRISLVPTKSQEFQPICVPCHEPSINTSPGLHDGAKEGGGFPLHLTLPTINFNLVVACHSHAPLQEFWDRVPAPKACISMPCCGRCWSTLSEADPPLLVYKDFEVFSPKREIKLYYRPIE